METRDEFDRADFSKRLLNIASSTVNETIPEQRESTASALINSTNLGIGASYSRMKMPVSPPIQLTSPKPELETNDNDNSIINTTFLK